MTRMLPARNIPAIDDMTISFLLTRLIVGSFHESNFKYLYFKNATRQALGVLIL